MEGIREVGYDINMVMCIDKLTKTSIVKIEPSDGAERITLGTYLEGGITHPPMALSRSYFLIILPRNFARCFAVTFVLRVMFARVIKTVSKLKNSLEPHFVQKIFPST